MQWHRHYMSLIKDNGHKIYAYKTLIKILSTTNRIILIQGNVIKYKIE